MVGSTRGPSPESSSPRKLLPQKAPPRKLLTMTDDPSLVSIIPIGVTLLVSLATRNVIIGLFLGVLSGVVAIAGPNPFSVMDRLVGEYLVGQVSDSYNAAVVVLLVFIGGFVALMERSGGGPAFAKSIMAYVQTQTRAQIFAWLGGISVFYSDLGTPLIVGPVFRPLFDRLKVSRQKLALIIDSTASPVAILIPFIGWGVYIISLIEKEIPPVDLPLGAGAGAVAGAGAGSGPDAGEGWGLSLFVSAIPFQFYAILAVLLLPWLALRKLDFGPMARAEDIARNPTLPTAQGKDQATPPSSGDPATGHPATVEGQHTNGGVFTHDRASAAFVFIPLVIMAATLLVMLVPHGFPQNPVPGSVFRSALSTAYFFAALSLITMMRLRGVRTMLDSVSVYLQGMTGMMSVAIMLILAWALSAIGKDLGAPATIASLAQHGFPPWALPATTFLVGAVISFATGSSWGTFAILFPLVIPTATTVDAPIAVTIAAVLSGGLFGDHCSPISETTILSSTGAGCDQFEHFRTQFPYAVFNGVLAFTGFVVAGLVPNTLVILPLIGVQFAGLYLVSRAFAGPTLAAT